MKVWTDVKFLVACLIAGFVAGYCIATAWESTTDKSFWDVASAVGTVGAVVVALIIALSQGVAARARERAHAILVAARLSGTVDAVIAASTGVHWACVFAQNPRAGSFFETVQTKALAAVAVTTSELMPLLPLPNHCAHRMATALGLVDMICTDIKAIGSAERWEEMTEAGHSFYFERWRVWAEEAHGLMVAAQRDFTNAVSLGVVAPTQREVYGVRE